MSQKQLKEYSCYLCGRKIYSTIATIEGNPICYVCTLGQQYKQRLKDKQERDKLMGVNDGWNYNPPKLVTIGLQKTEYGQYRIYYKENGRDIDSKACYVDDYIDAFLTLQRIYRDVAMKGHEVKIATSKVLDEVTRKYNKFTEGDNP